MVIAFSVLLLFPVVGIDRVFGQDDEEEDPLPARIDLQGNDLMTKDGVQLSATFYPGTEKKESVPVILLHMHKGDRKAYDTLALFLQEKGHAVLVPDLRGHGKSTNVLIGNTTRELEMKRLTPEHFNRMVRYDMETLKSFLIQEHNKGELNIEKLCVIGAEMGASVALDWARRDWSWPVLIGKKQGQDVKALVLISPKWSFPGLNLRNAMNHPAIRTEISTLLVVGKGSSRSTSEAKRIYSMIDRYRQPPNEDAKPSLFYFALDTKLQGTKMLDVKTLRVLDAKMQGSKMISVKTLSLDRLVNVFIDLRLVQQQIDWRER